ncbi:hypothetical protein B0H11DRAFT_1947988 [Mycena galericulata]|nr:hypothetical protein B0H11DRAFT_1947988 [Mycena galericulata]
MVFRRLDRREILSFTVRELQRTEDAGERVWTIGHIPLGSEDTMTDQVCRFLGYGHSVFASYIILIEFS